MKEFMIELGKIAALLAVAAFVVGIFLPTTVTIGIYIAEQVHDVLPAKVCVEKGLNE